MSSLGGPQGPKGGEGLARSSKRAEERFLKNSFREILPPQFKAERSRRKRNEDQHKQVHVGFRVLGMHKDLRVEWERCKEGEEEEGERGGGEKETKEEE